MQEGHTREGCMANDIQEKRDTLVSGCNKRRSLLPPYSSEINVIFLLFFIRVSGAQGELKSSLFDTFRGPILLMYFSLHICVD